MSQQTYPVKCECGKIHPCPAGYAGRRFACPCGKVVDVPSLTELRRAVSQTQNGTILAEPPSERLVDAELEIGNRLRRGSLPVETACVLCQGRTLNAVPILVVCEQERYTASGCWWVVLLVPPLTPIGLIVMMVRSQLGTGRNVTFHLPVRVCERCQPAVFTKDGVMDAMRATPLYARLLKQFPETTVSAAGSDAKSLSPGAMYRQRERRLHSRSLGVVAGVVMFLFLLIQGNWMVDAAQITGTDLDKLRMAEWDGWCRFGVLLISAALAVLVGVGVTRLVAGIHRHFWPDLKDE